MGTDPMGSKERVFFLMEEIIRCFMLIKMFCKEENKMIQEIEGLYWSSVLDEVRADGTKSTRIATALTRSTHSSFIGAGETGE